MTEAVAKGTNGDVCFPGRVDRFAKQSLTARYLRTPAIPVRVPSLLIWTTSSIVGNN